MKLRKVVLLLLVVLLIGCSGKVEEMDRAVFAWEGVDEEGLEIIKKYGINTILLDYNHTSDLSSLSSSSHSILSSSTQSILASYNIFILAGSPEWGVAEMRKVVDEAEEMGVGGVVYDIEGDYAALADNLEKLNTDFPVYVCIPFWLDEMESVGDENGKKVVERIIKATDGVFILNYYKGEEGKQAEFEENLTEKYGKKLWTTYELQRAGTYDLKEYNTYFSDGVVAVEGNYKEQFSGTDVGIAFHNLEMMKELDK